MEEYMDEGINEEFEYPAPDTYPVDKGKAALFAKKLATSEAIDKSDGELSLELINELDEIIEDNQ